MTAVPLWFRLPGELSADRPPEARGLGRDQVRLLVAASGGIEHTRFSELVRFLGAGDVLVVNSSATLPAAVDGRRAGGRPVTVHFSTALGDGAWVVELRPTAGATGPVTDAVAGESVDLPGGGQLRLTGSHPEGRPVSGRLWRAHVTTRDGVLSLLRGYGRPISYSYVRGSWPLPAYQTVFATHPGSAEMPSAGRPFSRRILSALVRRGVVIAPVTLHTGVSSAEKGESPMAEPFVVPEATARVVSSARRAGRRIVAVGTTSTRALETAVGPDGEVGPASGWTELVLGFEHRARVVTGLVTGWHAPGASHLRLLEAVAGRGLVERAYDEALRHRYLWHEFGDSCLLLP